MRTNGLVDNVVINAKGTNRGLDNIDKILSDNLKEITKKVDYTYAGVVISSPSGTDRVLFG